MMMLGKLGIDSRSVRAIIEVSKGLSLNDVHWVVPDRSKAKWSKVNLYDNPFSEILSVMVFTGLGPNDRRWPQKVDLTSTSPEFTTNGMLAKCWRRIDGTVYLYKSGTEGAANTGFEPYSEYYASQVAEALGLPHVEYGLEKFKGRICSTRMKSRVSRRSSTTATVSSPWRWTIQSVRPSTSSTICASSSGRQVRHSTPTGWGFRAG